MIIQVLLITLLTTFASIMCSITGFGTTTISLPILLLFFPIHESLLFTAIIHWIENIWRLILFRKGFNLKIILQVGIPALLAAYLGAKSSIEMPEHILAKVLGTFLLLYSVFFILKSKYRLPKNIITASAAGISSGFFAGIIGLGGAIRSAFLNAFGLSSICYIFSTNAISLLIDTARVPVYFFNGSILNNVFLWTIVLFAPLSLFGTIFAHKIVVNIRPEIFRVIVTIFLGLAGIKFLLFY